VVSFTFFFLAQLCDIVKLAIIHKLILSNLAIEKYERKSKLTSFLERGRGVGGKFFQTIIEFVIFFPKFS
jgi:hypothetical protein